jgi:hypothetical protein
MAVCPLLELPNGMLTVCVIRLIQWIDCLQLQQNYIYLDTCHVVNITAVCLQVLVFSELPFQDNSKFSCFKILGPCVLQRG